MLYIVVPTFNRLEIFQKFIEQLNSQTVQDYYLIVVDHGKKKTNYRASNCKVIESNVNGWSYAINIGIREGLEISNENDSFLIINDDVTMDSSYIENVYRQIELYPDSIIGSVCFDCKTYKTIHVNMLLNKLKAAFIYKNVGIQLSEIKGQVFESDVLKGRGTVFPCTVFKNVGLYNERLLPHYRADHELVWRAKKEKYNVITSGDMYLGATLDSPNTVERKYNFRENYRRIFKDMISTQNTKDLVHYSYLCFGKVYGTYYLVCNWTRYHIAFVRKYLIGGEKRC